MSKRPAHRPPPPPPPAPVCASGAAAHEPDPRPAAERLGDRRLRAALGRYVAACHVPQRQVEDVLHKALVNAWEKRDKWPATPFEFERWMFTLAYRRSIDDHRDQKRRPLVKPQPQQEAEHDAEAAGQPEDDARDDARDPAATVAPVDQLEMREGLRLAAAEVERNPTWKRAFGWTLRSLKGESYGAIAAADGVTEEAVRSAIKKLRENLRARLPDVASLFVCIAIVFFLYAALHRRKDDMAIPAPKPAPTIVAPSPAPTPLSQAKELRDRALSECSDGLYDDCQRDLDAAKDLDPDGEQDPRVQQARRGIDAVLHRHLK